MKFLILFLVCVSECNAGVVGRSFKTESNILFDPDEVAHHNSNVSLMHDDEHETHHSSRHNHLEVSDDMDKTHEPDVHSDDTEDPAVSDKTSAEDQHGRPNQSHSHHSDEEHSNESMEQSSQLHPDGHSNEISEALNSIVQQFEHIPQSEINLDNFNTNISIEVHSTAEGVHSHLNITIGNETFMSTSIPTDLHVNSSPDTSDHVSTLDNLDLLAQVLTDNSNEHISHREVDVHEMIDVHDDVDSDAFNSHNVKVSESVANNDSQNQDTTKDEKHGTISVKNNSNLADDSRLVKQTSDNAQNSALNLSLSHNQSENVDFHHKLNLSTTIVSNQSSKNRSDNVIVDTINDIVNATINVTRTVTDNIVNATINVTKTVTDNIVNATMNVTKTVSDVVEIDVSDITKNAALAMDIFNISQDASVADHLIQESILHDIIDMISPESVHDHKIQNDSSVISDSNNTIIINSSVSQNNTNSVGFDEKHDVNDVIQTINNSVSLNVAVKVAPVNLTNVTTSGQKINSTVGKLGKCPPPGFCLFSFWAQDTCATNNHCAGSMICCKIRCSKTCIEA